MIVIRSSRGFPNHWRAGKLENEIVDLLESKAKAQLTCERVFIVNLTWLHDEDLPAMIAEANPDFIICYNFVDPLVEKLADAVKNSGIPYVLIGNTDHFRLDFWAMVCSKHFKKYSLSDVCLSSAARKFICLNRKPHWHRVKLVNNLINAGLKDQGHISLGLPGDDAIVLDTVFSESQGIADEYRRLGAGGETVSSKIKNDIYSLGDLDIWRNSYLCLVTETEFEFSNPDSFFISEKTWKPVVGLRPFFVYGQHKLREYLKDQGFDIFEDIFDYRNIDTTSPDQGLQVEQYSQVAVDAITNVKDPKIEWDRMLLRLSKNEILFERYIDTQWQKLYALNLKKYV